MRGLTGRHEVLLKKVSFLAVVGAVLFIFFSPSLNAAPVAPLYQPACPSGDAGVPAWLCTQLTQIANDLNALRTGVNSVNSTQAPTLAPKTGYVSTGAIKVDNSGFVVGTSVSGVSGRAGAIIHQTADAGLIAVGNVGNDYRIQTALSGAQFVRLENTTDGGLDAGHMLHLAVQGGIVQGTAPVGYYYNAVAIGLSGSYGTKTTFLPEFPHNCMSVMVSYRSFGGSFGAAADGGTETVTMRRVYTYGDGTTVTMDPVIVTTTGGEDIVPEFNDMSADIGNSSSFQPVCVTKIDVDAKTDQAATTVTARVIYKVEQN